MKVIKATFRSMRAEAGFGRKVITINLETIQYRLQFGWSCEKFRMQF